MTFNNIYSGYHPFQRYNQIESSNHYSSTLKTNKGDQGKNRTKIGNKTK